MAASPLRRALYVLLAWDALWWGAIGLFAAPLLPGGWLAILVAALVALAPVVVIGRVFRGETYPGVATRVLVLRPFLYAQLGLPIAGLGALLGALAGLATGAPVAGARVGLVVALGLYATLALVGYVGSRRLVVRKIEAFFDALPDALDGLRVVQVSDLHVGPHTPRSHLAAIVKATRGLDPHLVAITGDQVDDHDADVAHFAAAFRDVSAPLGVFAVAGNHDVYAGWHGVRAGLEKMGVKVLVNEAVPVAHGAASFYVAGTGDPAGLHWHAEGGADAAPDVERTLAGVPPDAFVLALAHNPALWPALASRGVHLTLSGHTHHGQFSVPFLKWCLASPFLEHAMGAHTIGASHLYINPGTNFWGLPLRIGAWPEVTAVTLRRGPAAIREHDEI